MYLKSLEIHGFKSFADRTHFEFDQGVTAIVGPNGCGKSNVVDAIRWVLGEGSAKALRGGEMADVIFKGTEGGSSHKKRSASGVAEVVMTLGDCEELLNTDYSEVSVTRKVYRDGKSEYRINGSTCRLKDVNELFMDTGIGRTSYSIMEQGKIDLLLSARPEDRRLVFEEAAGITKFKKEKKEALRRLEHTERNIERISDVLGEQEKQVQLLSRQMHKARNFKALREDLKVIEVHCLWNSLQGLEVEKRGLIDEVRSLENTEALMKADLPEKEAAIEKLKQSLTEKEAQLTRVKEKQNSIQKRFTESQGEIRFNQERLLEWKREEVRSKEELSEIKLELEVQLRECEEASDRLKNLTQAREEEQKSYEFLSKAHEKLKIEYEANRETLRVKKEELGSEKVVLASVEAKIEAWNSERQRDLAAEAAGKVKGQELAARLEEVIEEKAALELLWQKMKQSVQSLETKFQLSERRFHHVRGDLDSARAHVSASRNLVAQQSSKLEVLQQLSREGAGFGSGTQAVLKGLKGIDQKSIVGLLVNQIEVEKEWSRAIEAALGQNLQAILVKDRAIAIRIVEQLRLDELGNASLVFEDSIDVSISLQMEHLPDIALAWAIDCVTAPAGLRGYVESLLSGVLVVEHLEDAFRLKVEFPNYSIVTKNGDFLSDKYVLSGGSGEKGLSSTLERETAIKELEELHRLGKSSLEQDESELLKIESLLEKQQELVDSSREVLQKERMEESNLLGRLSLAEREVQVAKLDCQNLERDFESNARRSTEQDRTLESLKGEHKTTQARLKHVEESVLNLESEIGRLHPEVDKVSEEVSQRRTEMAVRDEIVASSRIESQRLSARIDGAKKKIELHKLELAELSDKIGTITEKTKELEKIVNSAKEEENFVDDELIRLNAEREGLVTNLESNERALKDGNKVWNQLVASKSKRDLTLAKLELRIESICNQCKEAWQVELPQYELNRVQLVASLARGEVLEPQSLCSFLGEEVPLEVDEGVALDPEMNDIVYADLASDFIDKGEAIDWGLAARVTEKLREEMNEMGPVSVDAIEEFEHLEARYIGEKKQLDDLVNGKRELVSVIDRINKETKSMFTTTFSQVRANFKNMFQVLFGENSQADLLLVSENEPLESGIEVIAKPPGKKLQTISLLSGGERSMTAVALMFSIYQIKPSPFCVLDELDAPLDEANIGRFLRVLERFVEKSQFIIVTHSKRTMERSNVMYGVTMEERGVSKKVGMQLTSDRGKLTDVKESSAQKAARELDA